MGVEVLARLVAVKQEIDVLAAHALDGAHRVDRLGQRAVGDRVGLARAAEGDLRPRQPDDADHRQRRHQHQSEQPELQIERQHDDDDAHQQQQVAEGGDRVFEEFLQRVHVALQAGHHPPDLGLVHEGERHLLEMGEHGAAEIEDHPLADMPHQAVLEVAGGVADQDDGAEHGGGELQMHDVAAIGEDRLVDRVADDQRDQELGAGIDQHRPERDQEPARIGPDIGHEAARHAAVVGGAEDLLVAADLRADDGARRPGRSGGGAHSAAPCNPPSRLSRACRVKILA